ncbi:hypothetical protein PENTCL1PPCAC_26116, partial [Pristionchus entomophagus]
VSTNDHHEGNYSCDAVAASCSQFPGVSPIEETRVRYSRSLWRHLLCLHQNHPLLLPGMSPSPLPRPFLSLSLLLHPSPSPLSLLHSMSSVLPVRPGRPP